MTNETDITEEEAPKRPRRTTSSSAPSNVESKRPASEFLAVVEQMSDVEFGRPYCAGALRHADIAKTDLITRSKFIEAINGFGKVRAFNA